MAIFKNPNNPVQPQCGVYGWFAQKDEQKPIAIYIGQAGRNKSSIPKGTLFRGVSELQRNTFCQKYHNYTRLDTDFIVGTTIKYFEKKGCECFWIHLCNDPKEEKNYVLKEKPILQNQNNAFIKGEFMMKRSELGYWEARRNEEGVREAERVIFEILDSEYVGTSRSRLLEDK